MTTRKHIATALAATLALGSLTAFAQGGPPDSDHDRGRPAYSNGYGPNGHGQPPDRRDRHDGERHQERDAGRYASRGPDRDDPRAGNGNWDPRYGDRWGGARQWHRGDRLPPEYRNRQYVVDDWRGHHLNAPPRGYQWVQVGGDYVLAAVATGIIANLIINH